MILFLPQYSLKYSNCAIFVFGPVMFAKHWNCIKEREHADTSNEYFGFSRSAVLFGFVGMAIRQVPFKRQSDNHINATCVSKLPDRIGHWVDKEVVIWFNVVKCSCSFIDTDG